jgi:hypothetical protein
MFRRTASIAMIVVAFSLHYTGNAGASSHNDACALLTDSQVSASIGVPVQPGKPMGPSMCQWEQSSASFAKARRVMLTVFGQMGSLSPVDRFNNSKAAIGGITKTPVAGVGDDAVFISTMGVALNVRSGSSAFQVRLNGRGLTPDQVKQMEIALAKQVIPKLSVFEASGRTTESRASELRKLKIPRRIRALHPRPVGSSETTSGADDSEPMAGVTTSAASAARARIFSSVAEGCIDSGRPIRQVCATRDVTLAVRAP